MKILITTYWYTPVINGVVASVVNLENELRKQGHEVRILAVSPNIHSYRDGDVYYNGSVSVGFVYPMARLSFGFNRKLIRELIDWKPDIVHSQCELITFNVSKHIAKASGAPLLETYHTVYEDYARYLLPGRIGKRMACKFSKHILNQTDGTIAPTNKVKDLLGRYGVRCPVHVIPSGINLERFEQPCADTELTALRGELGLDAQKPVMVTVGRVAEEKNIEELIDFVHRLQDTELTYLIVGGGPHLDILKKKVAEIGEEKRIRFTGMVDPTQIPKYYRLGTFFASASTSETQGLTYTEALSCGLPALCRRDPAIDGLVVEDETGYQYETFEQFEKAVHRLCSEPEHLAEMKKNAVIQAQPYSVPAFGHKVEAVYQSLIH